MSFSAAGLAAVTLLGLILGVLIPQQLRFRQALVDSRVDDRFSGQLRVVAVGLPSGTQGATARFQRLSGGGRRAELGRGGSALGDGRVQGESAVEAPVGRGPERRLALPTVGQAKQTTSSERNAAPTQARGEGVSVPARPVVDSKRAVLLRDRAARARRRLILTIALLAASAVAWALVPTIGLAWYVGLAPSGLLGAVLISGTMAARKARRADAAHRQALAVARRETAASRTEPTARRAETPASTDGARSAPGVRDKAESDDKTETDGQGQWAPRAPRSPSATRSPNEARSASFLASSAPETDWHLGIGVAADETLAGTVRDASSGVRLDDGAGAQRAQAQTDGEPAGDGFGSELGESDDEVSTDSLGLPLNEILARRRLAS